ncbi:MAG: FAD binding domain-containing protein [Actinomycetota bacterium]
MSVFVATTLEAALRALSEQPDAAIIAGGTDLMIAFNGGHASSPAVRAVVSVNRVAELCSWSFDPERGTLRIGAGVRWAEIERAPFTQWVPALAQAARTVGSPQIRHAGTIGGNLGTASPAGDGLPVLAALGAVVHLVSVDGQRDVPFSDFMVGPKRTVRQPGELILAVSVPVLRGWQGYAKVGVRNAMVIATASVAFVVDEAAANVRMALGSVGPVILRCPELEALVASEADFAARTLPSAVVEQCRQLACDAARPITDHRSTAEYRRHAVGVLATRMLRRAFPNE